MKLRYRSCAIFLAVLWLIVPTGAPAEVATTAIQRSDPTLLQFVSAGHVLGFAQNSVYVAGGTHALRVEFVNAYLTAPISVSPRRETTHAAPLAWQELSNGGQVPVDVAFTQISEREVGFEAGMYDYSLPLFIDQSLTWNTFLGGTTADQGFGIAVDGSGNVYVTGWSDAAWGSPIQGYSGGSSDTFAAKLDGSGNLMWNTFLGGSGQDVGHAIALDGSGNVYVAGYSDATWGAPVRAYAGDYDAFAAKLDSSGNLTWNTFLGSSDVQNLNKGDIGHGIAVDGSGNVYVTGYGWDTWGSPIRAHAGSRDAFAAKLDGSGNLTWNTFLGSDGDDFGEGIAVDRSGNSYAVGKSCGSWGSPVRAYAGYCDGFVAKLDGSGSLAWNTFLGGSANDSAAAVAMDGSGNEYVVGFSDRTWGSPVRAYAGDDDAFAAKLDSSGNLTWNTFLGGSANDYGYEITADGSGNAYVVGYSRSAWGSPDRPFEIAPDAFTAGLDSSGNLTWNTFLGGGNSDYGYTIVADGSRNVYVSGTSFSTWGSPIRPYTGAGDAFVVKLLVARPEKLYLPLIVR